MVEFFDDPATRIRALVTQMQPKFRARFLEVIDSIKDQMSLKEIEDLIILGRIDDAIIMAEVAALRLSNTFGEVMILSGQAAAEFIGNKLEIIVNFDSVNHQALSAMQENQLRIVREFTAEQRLATQEALLDGIQRGINPNQMAVAVRDSIGLTQYQQQIVNNYRRNLEQLDSNALARVLRDKRFDPTVARAIAEGNSLTAEQIDRMVDRYREKWLKYRSEVIARTESLRSVHEGTDLMYHQAVENGALDENDLVRTWDTSKRPNVRDSHRFMEGQKRKMDEPFVSGLGNHLMRPGDINAPGADTIDCKCAVTTRFSDRAKLEAQQLIPQLITT
jgi:hypothetical protein